jgi:hypothetical protein
MKLRNISRKAWVFVGLVAAVPAFAYAADAIKRCFPGCGC